MKKVFAAIALLLVISGKGQKDSLKHSFYYYGFGIQTGAAGMDAGIPNQSYMAQLAPNDTSLRKDFSQFKASQFANYYTFNINAYATFVPKKADGKRNERIEFRIGLIYQGSPARGIKFFKKDSVRLDTFASSTTGMVVYKDSLSSHEYNFIYRGKKAGLDFSNTFQLNRHPAFRIYAGYSLCLFYSYDNYIHSGYSNGMYRRGWFGKNRANTNLQQSHLQNNFLLCGSIPIGVSLRLANKKKNKVYRPAINVEMRIGITEDKLGKNYLSAKPWYVFTMGLKLYRHRNSFYKD
jgi:hypothetical protein